MHVYLLTYLSALASVLEAQLAGWVMPSVGVLAVAGLGVLTWDGIRTSRAARRDARRVREQLLALQQMETDFRATFEAAKKVMGEFPDMIARLEEADDAVAVAKALASEAEQVNENAVTQQAAAEDLQMDLSLRAPGDDLSTEAPQRVMYPPYLEDNLIRAAQTVDDRQNLRIPVQPRGTRSVTVGEEVLVRTTGGVSYRYVVTKEPVWEPSTEVGVGFWMVELEAVHAPPMLTRFAPPVVAPPVNLRATEQPDPATPVAENIVQPGVQPGPEDEQRESWSDLGYPLGGSGPEPA